MNKKKEKNIGLLDLDYYYKNSLSPNPTLMKLSSFLKQKGHSINFIETESHLKMKYDELYIIRENTSRLVAPEILNDEHTFLIGSEFEFFPRHIKLPAILTVIRPDYQLYNFDKLNIKTSANFIQFFYNGKLFKKRQEFHNTISGLNKLVIMDEDFWTSNEEDMIWALTFLQNEKNISFKFPIRLSRLLSSPKAKSLFFKLKFSLGTEIVFKNDFGHTLEDLKEAIDFIGELNKKIKRITKTKLRVASITANHYEEPEKAQYDFIRVLKVIDYAKQRNVRLIILAPKKRIHTPFYDDFRFFEIWTTTYGNKSFVAAMLQASAVKLKVKWWEVLNNSRFWRANRVKQMITYLLVERELIEKYGFRINGDEFDDVNKIDFNELEKFRLKSTAEEIK